jgi:hypothetical protein
VLHPPLAIVTVDDDAGQTPAPSPTTWLAESLSRLGVPLGPGGSRILLALSEPRAWKGWAGFGPASREALARETAPADLVVLFTHPRHLAALPGDGPVLLAWHRQRLTQEAAARWIAAHLG